MRLIEFLKATSPLITELASANPQFKAWFGNSKVVDKAGSPLVVYHATHTTKEFGKLRGLTHFGSHGAASDIAFPGAERPTRFYPVYLKIENPLLIRDGGEGHDAYEYANSMGIALDKMGMTKEAVLPIIWSLGVDWNEEAVWKYYRFSEGLRNALENTPMSTVKAQSIMFNRLRTWKRLRMIIGYLEGLGFDGFTYTNEVEDPGSISWVPFRSSQIRYAYSEGQLDEGILDVLPPGARQLAMAVAMLSVLSTAQGHESTTPHPVRHPSVTRDRDFSERLSAIADIIAAENADRYGQWISNLYDVYRGNPEAFKRMWGVDYDKFLTKARNSAPQDMAQYMKDVAQSLHSTKVKEAPLQDFDFVQSSGRLDTPASQSFSKPPERDPAQPLLTRPMKGSTRKPDWAYLTNPKVRARTFKKFDKTPYNFKVVVYDTEVTGTGKIFTIPEWGDQTIDSAAAKYSFMSDFQPDPNAINIIYTNNEGANKVPFSPWIMMHRFSHIFDNYKAYVKIRDAAAYGVQSIMQNNYEPSHAEEALIDSWTIFQSTSGVGLSGEWANYVWDFFNSVGNFKSARNSNMTHAYEFFTELMPLYVLTGNISFRPAPEEILYRGTTSDEQKTASPRLHPPMILQNPQQPTIGCAW
jgi:hypothetical protein